MTTFLGAMPRQSSQPVTCFRLSAADEPSVLSRVLDVFAKLTIVPDTFHAARSGNAAESGALDVRIRISGLDHAQSEHLARNLRRIIHVETVLVASEELPRRQTQG